MPDLSPKSIKKDARLFLAAGPTNYIKLILIYLAFFLGAKTFSSLIAFAAELMMANTGGLSGTGTRVVLESTSVIVALGVTILTFFWTMGLTHCSIGLARQDRMEPDHLKEGFYRFGVILRLLLAQGLVYMLAAYFVNNLASVLLLLLPGGELLINYLQNANPDTWYVWPSILITVVLSAVVFIPLFYGYRMSFYRVMDDGFPGALLAIAQSRRMMKGTRLKLFLLDLSFWWYYGLQLLIVALSVLPVFLLRNLDQNVLSLCSVVIQCIGLFILDYKCRAFVETSYAVFYDRLYQYHKEKADKAREAAREAANNNPWTNHPSF